MVQFQIMIQVVDYKILREAVVGLPAISAANDLGDAAQMVVAEVG